MTKERQTGDKPVAVKQQTDPRTTKCPVNQWQRHRWAKTFKDEISKGSFITFVRCRYCAHFVSIQLDRVVLPSGRVIVTEIVRAVDAPGKVSLELHTEVEVAGDTKQIDNPSQFKNEV